MSMKEELIQWHNGCVAFEDGDYYAALNAFEPVADTSKIHFNMAITFQNLRQIDEQISCLTKAIACDVYMAISYFLRGVCFLKKNMMPEALADFTDALAFLRGNLLIDYTQLGLPHKLYACEVSFNRGLCFAAVNQIEAAMADFDDALRTKPLDSAANSQDYRRIDEAIDLQSRAPDYCRPFEVPNKAIFKPPAGKIKNTEKVNYLGKSKVVAAVDESDSFAGFSGTKLKAETLSRNRSQGPLEGDNNFSSAATIGRGTMRKASSPNVGLDGSPISYASLSRRAFSATTNVPDSPTPRPDSPNLPSSPNRRPSGPAESRADRDFRDREPPRDTRDYRDREPPRDTRGREPPPPRDTRDREPPRDTRDREPPRDTRGDTTLQREPPRDRPSPPGTSSSGQTFSPRQSSYRNPMPPIDDPRGADRYDDRDRGGGGSPSGGRGLRGRSGEDDRRAAERERQRDRARSQGRSYNDDYESDSRRRPDSREGRREEYGGVGGGGGRDEFDDMGARSLNRRNTAVSLGGSSSMSSADKLKIKCHYTDTRILLVPVTITYEDLSSRIQKKFQSPKPLKLKYKDVDQELVLMTDQEDMEVAFEMAGIEYGVVGGGDRFEIWCFL